MAPIDLNLIRAFVAVHETGSFSAAGARLTVPRSTVSRAVAALEQSLSLLLFHRTTRTVTTTEAGKTLYERVSPLLTSLDLSLAEVPERAEAPSGLLRVTSTLDLGISLLSLTASRFTARYPDVQVDLHVSDAVVDMARDGFDLALRIASGPLPGASTLIAQKVGRAQARLYASPSYLARRGTPRSVPELSSHSWVVLHGYTPPFAKALSKHCKSKSFKPRVTCDNMLTMRELLRTGTGIGILPTHLAEGDLMEGTLVDVMPQWYEQTSTVYLVHPSKQHVPLKVTLFRDLLREQLRRSPLSLAATRTATSRGVSR
jgi:DNA-binding transcriptional LysR family regulator